MTQDERFDRMEKRFDRMDERFQRIDESIERLVQFMVEQREETARLSRSMAEQREETARLSRGLAEQREETAHLYRYVMELREEAIRRFDVIDHRLDLLSSTTANLDSRLPSFTKGLLDFGSVASQLGREQAREKDVSSDLATRVARLEEQVSKLINPAA